MVKKELIKVNLHIYVSVALDGSNASHLITLGKRISMQKNN